MSHNQLHFNQPSTVAYPPPPPSTAPGPYVTAPPAGYPMSKDEYGQQNSQIPVAVETKSRGDGFWKGCCAALCCCCVLDACF